jgi:hypothetical protein
MRIYLRMLRGLPVLDELAEPSPREAAAALFGLAAVIESGPREGVLRECECMAKRLVEMRNPDRTWGRAPRDGAFDARATCWAIVAMRAVGSAVDSTGPHRLRVPTIDWSVVREFPGDEELRVTAALLRRRAESDDPEDPSIRRLSVRLCDALAAEPRRPLDAWYLGAMALKPDWGEEWNAWRSAMVDAVVRTQRSDGSWSDGGEDLPARIRATAVAVLCLRAGTEP